LRPSTAIRLPAKPGQAVAQCQGGSAPDLNKGVSWKVLLFASKSRLPGNPRSAAPLTPAVALPPLARMDQAEGPVHKMKLPFEFGIKLIFRLVLPGAILAAAFAPLVHWWLHLLGIWIKIEYLFWFEALGWGWAVVISDMQIYMLFEGRRYWPDSLRQFFMHCQERRLTALHAVVVPLRSNPDPPRRDLELAVKYSEYPVNDDGEARVESPTRLGNIIEAYESYPNTKYGLDSVFYWYRLWVVLDKDLREEIDTAQALVDSTIYLAFAFYLSGVMMFIYGFIELATHVFPYVPAPHLLFISGVFCFVIGFSVYRVSLEAHNKFGELFKSLFDQYRSKLIFDDVVAEVRSIMGDFAFSSATKRQRNQIVWRYLRWHLIRDEAAGANLTVKQWKER
jgi:hypothetical protein